MFKKLDEWGFDTMVIPHGSTWGIDTPPDSSWDFQLVKTEHDPEKMNLIEVYSGHGNSENYRDFRARPLDANGQPSCPAPGASGHGGSTRLDQVTQRSPGATEKRFSHKHRAHAIQGMLRPGAPCPNTAVIQRIRAQRAPASIIWLARPLRKHQPAHVPPEVTFFLQSLREASIRAQIERSCYEGQTNGGVRFLEVRFRCLAFGWKENYFVFPVDETK